MSLYLKYRPSDFDNLMWQKFVKETLQKAIAQNKTVWAYLLCWPRWTWKTTTARLLAKSINCLNLKDWNPCNECEICRDFKEDKLVDIIEIDAASHTWVDNIREIIERAKFTPSKTKYKIYIIDEVHMLSKWAFNALLKILEEPPTHVKFILATTETNKVPETIISRCQRYDFKRINNSDIKQRLSFIAKQEWISVDDKSYEYIVSNSAWWLRNAISLFEQMIVDNTISYSNIVDKLWIIDEEKIDNILYKLLNFDNSVINDIDLLIDDWKNLKIFFKDLIFTLKNKILDELKNWNDINNLIFILDTLNKAYSESKNSLDENLTLMIWVFKIISNYTEPNNNLNTNIDVNKITKTTIIKQETDNTSITPLADELKNNNSEIKIGDIDDVFWDPIDDISISNDNIKTANTTEYNSNKEVSSNFDISKFISNLKTKWAKWSLTMALRWSMIKYNNNIITIKSSTSFTKKSIDNVDSIAIMKSVLDDMWLVVEKIDVI